MLSNINIIFIALCMPTCICEWLQLMIIDSDLCLIGRLEEFHVFNLSEKYKINPTTGYLFFVVFDAF